MSAAALIALMPWIASHAPESLKAATGGLEFSSVMIGLMLGLTLGSLGRYNWAEIPRRVVTWALVRERQFFYYALIAICAGVLFFY